MRICVQTIRKVIREEIRRSTNALHEISFEANRPDPPPKKSKPDGSRRLVPLEPDISADDPTEISDQAFNKVAKYAEKLGGVMHDSTRCRLTYLFPSIEAAQKVEGMLNHFLQTEKNTANLSIFVIKTPPTRAYADEPEEYPSDNWDLDQDTPEEFDMLKKSLYRAKLVITNC
jgi:hypothetical protein